MAAGELEGYVTIHKQNQKQMFFERILFLLMFFKHFSS